MNIEEISRNNENIINSLPVFYKIEVSCRGLTQPNVEKFNTVKQSLKDKNIEINGISVYVLSKEGERYECMGGRTYDITMLEIYSTNKEDLESIIKWLDFKRIETPEEWFGGERIEPPIEELYVLDTLFIWIIDVNILSLIHIKPYIYGIQGNNSKHKSLYCG